MPISSLPSPYGIGTFGKSAEQFADFLHNAGQTYWQILPLGQTGYGNSPYSSVSAFAGNPLFIDLDQLIEYGFLTRQETEKIDWGADPQQVDYGKVAAGREILLAAAEQRARDTLRGEIEEFRNENSRWLLPYARYMKERKGWEEELSYFIQYMFFFQWNRLKTYVNSLGIRIIGDIPIYVPMDSVDFLEEPELFRLDSDRRPAWVAGVPPDYFSEEGQLWGNPVYDFDRMKKNGYEWWIRRIGSAARLYDVIRIDHFRGLESYWAIPAGAESAKCGHWEKGPGMDLVGTLTGWFSDTEFIAEDLGILTPQVRTLIKESGIPGMTVLEFAFSPDEESNYLPHNLIPHSVCYTGTHDNAPVNQWKEMIPKRELEYAMKYLDARDESEICERMIRAGMGSVAELFIVQMQDWLGLGEGSRTNEPGTVGGNWSWRMLPDAADCRLSDRIRDITATYRRIVQA